MPRSAASAAFRRGDGSSAAICKTLPVIVPQRIIIRKNYLTIKASGSEAIAGKISVDGKGDVWYSNRTRERKALIFVFYFEKQYIYYIIRGGN